MYSVFLRKKFRHLTLAAVAVSSLLAFTLSLAHEIRPTVANLNLAASGYTLELNLNLEALLAGISPDHEDTDDSPDAAQYNRLRGLDADSLQLEFEKIKESFLNDLAITDDSGQVIRHTVQSLDIGPVGDLSNARDSIMVLSPLELPPDGKLIWQWPAQYGASIIRVNQPNGETRDDDYSAFLAAGESSIAIPLEGRLSLSTAEVVKNYLKVGFTHIVPKGLDHILFVVGLFLLGAALRPLLIQVTSFTLAHTVTLALGATGVVQLSPSIVEPLIAASIVYVAIENMMSDKLQKWRPVIVFLFGLLHGLGFAGVLNEVGIASGFFITALVAFNVGVELGQLFVILICFLLVGFWFRNKSWYRQRITIPGSVIIAAIGAFWFFERVFG